MLALLEILDEPDGNPQKLLDAFFANPYAALAIKDLWDTQIVEVLPDPPNEKYPWFGFKFSGGRGKEKGYRYPNICYMAWDPDDRRMVVMCYTGQSDVIVELRPNSGSLLDFKLRFDDRGRFMYVAPGAVVIDGEHLKWQRPERTFIVDAALIQPGGDIAVLVHRRDDQAKGFEIHSVNTGRVIRRLEARSVYHFARVSYNGDSLMFVEKTAQREFFLVEVRLSDDDPTTVIHLEKAVEVSRPCYDHRTGGLCCAFSDGTLWSLWMAGTIVPTVFDHARFEITEVYQGATGFSVKTALVVRNRQTKKVRLVHNGIPSPEFDEVFSIDVERGFPEFGARIGRQLLHVMFDP
ncbi:MAG: hypothetical protein NT003_02520 [Candidatus Magasanikbacteria bacterium]|nr:hypothetical protein [Candidatus Magasanikbacteria bacterium]